MELLALATAFVSLCCIIYQDLKYRHIHVMFPVVIFAAGLYLIRESFTLQVIIRIVGYNVLFFLLTFAVMVLYMSMRQGRFRNPFLHYFGLGDLLFYLALTPFFLVKNYIAFFIFSMLFSVLMFVFFRKLIQKETIPLAGYAAILFTTVLLADRFFGYSQLLVPGYSWRL